jgi:hypothetical protein
MAKKNKAENEDVRTTQKRCAHHCTESLRVGVEILDADYN